ncbi:type II secretion system protein GspG [Pseudoalteromonas luteoviolacea]|nr:type II secretion system protein GspG [Pseudoalteromonas luteoviolacea]
MNAFRVIMRKFYLTIFLLFYIFSFSDMHEFFSFDENEYLEERINYEANSIKEVIFLFKEIEGKLPEDEEGLEVLITNQKGFFRGAPHDPWGVIYRYKKINDNEFSISTLGGDNKVGGNGKNKDYSIDYKL